MLTLTRAVQTAMGCPSQWDAWDADGNYYYLRYRHGQGQVTQFQTPDWVGLPSISANRGFGSAYTNNSQFIRHVTFFEYGGEYDGVISLTEFARHAGIFLAPGVDYTGFGDHIADQLTFDGIDPEAAQSITQPWRNLPHGPGDAI